MAAAPIPTDALVIGAGPVGLWQVFQLGLHGIACQVVDALPEPGGQPQALYPDKPLYDIPGLPRCTGRELTQRLLQQVSPFKPGFHLGHTVTSLVSHDGRWRVTTRDGQAWDAASVIIAGGVGAFEPRALKLDGVEAMVGRDLRYHLPAPGDWDGLHCAVLGGDADAVTAALDLAARAGPPVTLVHRRDVFDAEPDALDALRAQRAAGRIVAEIGQPVALLQDGGRLRGLQLARPDGTTDTLAMDRLLVRLGLSPKLGPIADWGLAMERKLLPVDPATLRTSADGVYAVGDINQYPGKKKLIVCGFHEATLAAFDIADRLRPHERGPLQYTTSSRLLQQRLGVAAPD